MKNNLLILIALIISSCSFLEMEPKDEISRDDYYKNDKQVYLALSGAYGSLRDIYDQDFSIWFNVGTDEMLYRRSLFNHELTKMSYNESDVDLNRIWTRSYRGVNRVNDLIQNLSERDTIENLSRADHDLMIGEGLTLRALYYFNLVRVWEHIPLRLDHFTDIDGNLDMLNLPNTPAPKVYNQIIEDLDKAITLLNDRPKEYGRVSKQIAHGLAARVYLTMAGARIQGGDIGRDVCLQKVIEHTNAVTEFGYHSLLPDYKEVFMNQIQGIRRDVEVMWEVDFTVTEGRDLGGRIGNFNGVQIQLTTGTMPFSIGHAYITPSMHKSTYGADDTRYEWNCANFSFNYRNDEFVATNIGNELRWFPGKWRRLDRGRDHNGELDGTVETLENGVIIKDRTSINFPILRFSDILLMRAEASYLLYGAGGQATADIEAVRARANAGSLSQGLSDANQDFMKLIQDERKRELCFEGHRRFDLVRWGILQETMQEVSRNVRSNKDFRPDNEEHLAFPGERCEEKHVVFPIPTEELQLNYNIKQHPLW
ncbi:RagB/SusD family nutrient uptake outer membrane protein [Flammeovirga sp. OC4]|uniref:RagB/SusD family nutrient uptake outer membrane protein n=1 Tax=Flammeovirga sp. OC4 TaxID=1382345 RepID=UPI0009E5DC00|nr:RagB/SusD family nutrient uptake outer membrane protein [Flammeovirga sp. OC4]